MKYLIITASVALTVVLAINFSYNVNNTQEIIEYKEVAENSCPVLDEQEFNMCSEDWIIYEDVNVFMNNYEQQVLLKNVEEEENK